MSMKLQPDLIKIILEEYEKLPYQAHQELGAIVGFTRDQVNYHQERLLEVGYIKANVVRPLGGFPIYYAQSLTMAGHEFLNLSRNNTNWNRAKLLIEKAGGFAFDVMKVILIELAKGSIGIS